MSAPLLSMTCLVGGPGCPFTDAIFFVVVLTEIHSLFVFVFCLFNKKEFYTPFQNFRGRQLKLHVFCKIRKKTFVF